MYSKYDARKSIVVIQWKELLQKRAKQKAKIENYIFLMRGLSIVVLATVVGLNFGLDCSDTSSTLIIWLRIESGIQFWDIISALTFKFIISGNSRQVCRAICSKSKRICCSNIVKYYHLFGTTLILHLSNCGFGIFGIIQADYRQNYCTQTLYYFAICFIAIKVTFYSGRALLFFCNYCRSYEVHNPLSDLELNGQLIGYGVVDRLIFHVPKPSYNDKSFSGNLCWIRIDLQILELTEFADFNFPIPALFFSPSSCSLKEQLFILYFHGNEEDLGHIHNLISALSNTLGGVAILAMEYPGYGIYNIKGKPTVQRAIEAAESVYFFIREELNLSASNIVLMGRSLGTGLALRLASQYSAAGLILISAFTSINDVASEVVRIRYIKKALSQRFDNLQAMKKVSCPLLMIHGKRDELIPIEHTKRLFAECKTPEDRKFLILSQEMSHNKMDIVLDILNPVSKFFKNTLAKYGQHVEHKMELPQGCFENPNE